MNPRVVVRPERVADHEAVRQVNQCAFPTPAEADLVDRLRPVAEPFVSLVAEDGGQIVGHIVLTPVQVNGGQRAMAIGPMAVRPERQNRGIGSRLVRSGLQVCQEMGETVVFVLGHPEFYPRFGFRPAATRELHYESEEYDPYFFVKELRPGALEGMRGLVRYHPAFAEV